MNILNHILSHKPSHIFCINFSFIQTWKIWMLWFHFFFLINYRASNPENVTGNVPNTEQWCFTWLWQKGEYIRVKLYPNALCQVEWAIFQSKWKVSSNSRYICQKIYLCVEKYKILTANSFDTDLYSMKPWIQLMKKQKIYWSPNYFVSNFPH